MYVDLNAFLILVPTGRKQQVQQKMDQKRSTGKFHTKFLF
jgi:hypothetical protein